ncbi:hypothetical protein VNO77_03628 [Canavalia gladiata]|uniref:Uncharacterized protein n=1 Tax=Canavalia gladiata TaxID=3824 RepID=A0AAN9N050_CANGL
MACDLTACLDDLFGMRVDGWLRVRLAMLGESHSCHVGKTTGCILATTALSVEFHSWPRYVHGTLKEICLQMFYKQGTENAILRMARSRLLFNLCGDRLGHANQPMRARKWTLAM